MIQNIPTDRLKTVVDFTNENGVEQACKILNLTENTIKRYKSELKGRGKKVEEVKVVQKIEQKDTIEATIVSSDRFTTAKQMAEYCDIDINIWEASSITTNQWGSDESPSWQFKVKWQRSKGITPGMVLKTLEENLKNYKPVKLQEYKGEVGEVLLEVTISDLHLGRLAWGKETGAPYDVNIAVKEWIKAHQYFYDRHKHLDVDTVLIPIGNDFYNVDSNINETTKGTPQMEDGRWQRSFSKGCDASVQAIEFWRSKGYKVEIKIVPGNHDTQRIYYLGTYLEAWYRDVEQVIIDNAPTLRKYKVYGINLIGWSHGDKDAKQLRHVYQSEMREYMSQCTNVEFHTAHLHQEKLVEDFGSVIIRTIPSLAQRSDWEYSKGFSGNRRAQAFVWHKTKGLMSIVYYTPEFLGK